MVHLSVSLSSSVDYENKYSEYPDVIEGNLILIW